MATKKQKPKKRGRKPGVKVGPRVGSLVWKLSHLNYGESMLVEVPAGRTVGKQMQTNGVSAMRASILISQSHVLAVDPTMRTVFDVIRIVRL